MIERLHSHAALVGVFLLSISSGQIRAQGCQAEGEEHRGRIVKMESQNVSGAVCGFNDFTFKGSYNSSTNYEKGSIIHNGGIFWERTSEGSGVAPSCSNDTWRIVEGRKYGMKKSYVSIALDRWEHNELFADPHDFHSYGFEAFIGSEIIDVESCQSLMECSGAGMFDDIDVQFDQLYGQRWNFSEDCDIEIVFIWEGNIEDEYTSEFECEMGCGPMFYDWWFRDLSSWLNGAASDIRYSRSVYFIRRYRDGYWVFPEDPNSYISSQLNDVRNYQLSDIRNGLEDLQAKLANLSEEDWEPGWAVSHMGNWNLSVAAPKFTYYASVSRFWVEFSCLPDDADLEFTYLEWPMCGSQEDGVEVKETKGVGGMEVEEREDGKKWVRGFMEPKDGFYRKLVKVVKVGECGDGSGGNNNSGESNAAGLSSVQWRVSLGKGSGGVGIGNLRIEQAALSSKSARPESLKFDRGMHPEVELIDGEDGGIRQLMTPDAFVDVVALDEYRYEIRFYDPLDAEPGVSVVEGEEEDVEVPTGLYEVNGVPFSVWRIENPDGAAASNQLKISHVVGEGSEVYEFEQGSNGLWTLDRNEEQLEQLVKTVLVNGDEEVTRTLKNSAGTVSSKVKTVERIFDFGKRPIERVEDPDGAALTTSWTYYDDGQNDGGAFGQIKQVVYADGSWERFEYDGEGRITKRVGPWLDSSIGAGDNASRVVTTAYAENAGVVTSTTIEKIEGEEVGPPVLAAECRRHPDRGYRVHGHGCGYWGGEQSGNGNPENRLGGFQGGNREHQPSRRDIDDLCLQPERGEQGDHRTPWSGQQRSGGRRTGNRECGKFAGAMGEPHGKGY